MTPARLTLSRAKGFNLQSASRALNGLEAVKVDRTTKFGNPFYVINEEGFPWLSDHRDPGMPVLNKAGFALIGVDPHDSTWEDATRATIALFEQRCIDAMPLSKLRGKNLACWCKPGQPCHADVLLKLANGPVCEGVN